MKLLVFAHELEIGGTQNNAIELAEELRDRHGFEVVLHATPGPMLDVVKSKRLTFVASPDSHFHPSRTRMQRLREVVKQERPSLIHAWDWWQALEAYYAVYLPMRVPLLVSDMMLELTKMLPRELPTTFGTPQMCEEAKSAGWRQAKVLLPPVDIWLNAPDAVSGAEFRRSHGVSEGEVVAVSVSRLSEHMKAEPLVRAMEAVRRLGQSRPIRLLIVGDGPARPRLAALATEINTSLAQRAIVLTGPLLDPRPAYAAADIVIGMGGSSLRGLAFGKPVIVVGANGFARPFTPENAACFHRSGMYGVGVAATGACSFADSLGGLIAQPEQRLRLGKFGRDFVVKEHSIEVLGAKLADICRGCIDEPLKRGASWEAIRTAMIYLRERRFL